MTKKHGVLFCFVVLTAFLSGCATSGYDLEVLLNKDKFEKELPYHEDDLVELKMPIKQYRSQLYNVELLREWNEQRVSRFGNTGYVRKMIIGVQGVQGIQEADFHQFSKPGSRSGQVNDLIIVAKVSKVSRTKEVSADFKDEFIFVKWGDQTQNQFAAIQERKSQEAATKSQENAEQRRLAEADKIRCKPFFDKIVALRRKGQQLTPEVQKQLLDNTEYIADSGSQLVEEIKTRKVINRATAAYEKEFKSVLMDSKYYGCPGSAKAPEYDPSALGVPDPMTVSLDANK